MSPSDSETSKFRSCTGSCSKSKELGVNNTLKVIRPLGHANVAENQKADDLDKNGRKEPQTRYQITYL